MENYCPNKTSLLFFPNNNENKYRNKETVRRLPRRHCTEDLFRQTQKHTLEQTHLSDALMPDEIMNPHYKLPSKLMREVFQILAKIIIIIYFFFFTCQSQFSRCFSICLKMILINRTWYTFVSSHLFFLQDWLGIKWQANTEFFFFFSYRIKQNCA